MPGIEGNPAAILCVTGLGSNGSDSLLRAAMRLAKGGEFEVFAPSLNDTCAAVPNAPAATIVHSPDMQAERVEAVLLADEKLRRISRIITHSFGLFVLSHVDPALIEGRTITAIAPGLTPAEKRIKEKIIQWQDMTDAERTIIAHYEDEHDGDAFGLFRLLGRHDRPVVVTKSLMRATAFSPLHRIVPFMQEIVGQNPERPPRLITIHGDEHLKNQTHAERAVQLAVPGIFHETYYDTNDHYATHPTHAKIIMQAAIFDHAPGETEPCQLNPESRRLSISN